MSVERFGWLGLHDEEKAFEQVLKDQQPENPVFSDARPERAAVDTPAIPSTLTDQGFEDGWEFWTATNAYFPRGIRPGPQDRGNCVGYSAVLSAVDGMSHEVYWLDEIEKPFIPLVHFSYGAGRVYIGNNRLGRGDGSLGAWQIAADVEYGFLPHNTPGLPVYPQERCEPPDAEFARWGYTRAILDQWKAKAAPYKIGAHQRLTSADDIMRVTVEERRNWTIASNQGFRKRGYDARYGITLWGFGGTWAHQMYGRAVVKIKGNWFVYIGNQWGEGYHGEPGRGPRGGFWIPMEVMDNWAPRAVIYARGKFKGQESTPPDFSGI